MNNVFKASENKAAYAPVLEERLSEKVRFAMLTLTIPHTSTDSLKILLQILSKALRKLMQRSVFKKHVRGYLWSREITYGEANGFHPHIHMIIEADYWEQQEIYEVWRECVVAVGGGVVGKTGVDIRALESLDSAINEVLGYAFKAADLLSMPEDKLLELSRATKSSRQFSASKKWSKRAKELSSEREDRVREERKKSDVDFLPLYEARNAARSPMHRYYAALPSMLEKLEEEEVSQSHFILSALYRKSHAKWMRGDEREAHEAYNTKCPDLETCSEKRSEADAAH